jgi:hypothetical protein
MEIRDAQQHKILTMKSSREDGDPSPILVHKGSRCFSHDKNERVGFQVDFSERRYKSNAASY